MLAASKAPGCVIDTRIPIHDRIKECKGVTVLKWLEVLADNAELSTVIFFQTVHAADNESILHTDISFGAGIERLKLDLPVQPSRSNGLLGSRRI